MLIQPSKQPPVSTLHKTKGKTNFPRCLIGSLTPRVEAQGRARLKSISVCGARVCNVRPAENNPRCRPYIVYACTDEATRSVTFGKVFCRTRTRDRMVLINRWRLR